MLYLLSYVFLGCTDALHMALSAELEKPNARRRGTTFLL